MQGIDRLLDIHVLRIHVLRNFENPQYRSKDTPEKPIGSLGKMECILGDSVDGAHDRVVSKLPFLAPIANERVFRGIKIIDSSSQSFAIGKNDPDELLVPFTPLHRDAPHPFQCSCEMQGAYAREGW